MIWCYFTLRLVFYALNVDHHDNRMLCNKVVVPFLKTKTSNQKLLLLERTVAISELLIIINYRSTFIVYKTITNDYPEIK